MPMRSMMRGETSGSSSVNPTSSIIRKSADTSTVTARLHRRWRSGNAFAITGILLASGFTTPTPTREPVTALADAGFEINRRPHSETVDWIEAMLMAIELNPPSPTVTTWRMWVVTSSMYDAYAAFDRDAIGTVTGVDLRRPARRWTDANRARAVDGAAHRALTFAFPEQAAIFDAVLALHHDPLDTDSDPHSPAAVGRLAADLVIAHRLIDGSNAQNGFAEITSATYPTIYQPRNVADPSAPNGSAGAAFDPNRWLPLRVPTGLRLDAHAIPVIDHADPDSYRDQRFLTPHWGGVEPFALTSSDQFRPPSPPQLGSSEPYVDALGQAGSNDEAYRAQAAELLELSGRLDDFARVSAEFWADGPHTWTPPGHWMQLAIGISLRDHHTLGQDVKMFMALSGGLLDAGIAAWDAKREFDYVRPASAIPHLYDAQAVNAWAGPNRGVQLIDGADWRPYQSPTFVTPPFSEYVSGHSMFSRTAAEILTAFAGSAQMYDGTTLLGRDYDRNGEEDLFGRHVATPGILSIETGPDETVTLEWDTFYDAADEAGYSRRYGGIHFQDGDLRARGMGASVGVQAYEQAKLWWNPFRVMIDSTIRVRNHGDLSAETARRLVVEFALAKVAFTSGAEQRGCRHLRRADQHLQRDDTTGDAIAGLSRQMYTVHHAICR